MSLTRDSKPKDRIEKTVNIKTGLKLNAKDGPEPMATVIAEFIPRVAPEKIWTTYFTITESLFREFNPRRRLPNRTAVKQMLLAPNPLYTKRWWMVLNDQGKASALGTLSYDTELSPDFEIGRSICHIQISVDHGYRRQKIAMHLLRFLIQVAVLLGKTTIRADTDNDTGHEFCKHLHGQMIHRETQHRLYLEDVDWLLVEQWIAKAKSRFLDTKIESFQECPEKDIKEFCSIYTEIINQRPIGDIREKIVMTPESRRIEESNMKKREVQWHTMFSREQDGHISALTDILYNPQEPYRVHQYFTGVLTQYRRRGLAKRLKAEMLKHIVKIYPEAEYITTTTAKENEPMRAINKQLGFTPRKTYHMYRWQIDELSRRVAKMVEASNRRSVTERKS